MTERLEDFGVLAEDLRQAGIATPEDLRNIGSKEAFLRLKTRDGGACLHMLTALEGAVQGVRKSLLPPETKEALKEFFNNLK